MRHGSLFAGIGGFDLGFERAGIETLWQVEIDGYCQKVLAKHWPDVGRFGDIKDCGKHNLKPVDIVSGGFPCQDISVAGKQAGIEGSRSGLWSEMYRIIGELRPRYAVIENVPNLIRLGLERVLCDLAEIGYDAEWQVVGADDVGAPHRRKRIWIVAYPQRGRLQGEIRPELQGLSGGQYKPLGRSDQRPEEVAEGMDRDTHGRDGDKRQIKEMARGENPQPPRICAAVADSKNPNGRGSDGTQHTGRGNKETRGCGISGDRTEYWSVEPDVGRVAHGIPSRVDRLKGLGNAIVPQIAEIIGRMIIES